MAESRSEPGRRRLGAPLGALPRVRAPRLTGRDWLNTGGRQLELADLAGRFVLLDFWTFCCVNCLHVIEELRPLEREYADELVVIGVHSPKFPHEADPDALRSAVERYDVRHPVLDDPELTTWSAYTARAWPTLVLIDPLGYVIAQYAGEGHAHAIGALLAEAVPRHRESGALKQVDVAYDPPSPSSGVLRFPASALALQDGTGGFVVADAGHHSIALVESDGATLRRRIGSGERGIADGPAEAAAFNEPSGLCFLPPGVAEDVGYDLVVADTANHALRGVDLGTGTVRTLVGDGVAWMHGDGVSRLSSPWDVCWWRGRLYVAMAGLHQLWTYALGTGQVSVVAGTGVEGLVDGASAEAWFAQPSGLAPDGERLWIADAEVSALRWLDEEGVHTAIGQGLFDFGFRDGARDVARLQHPLGVAVLADGSVAVADTYNGAVRRYDPVTEQLSTVATDLPEVSGLVPAGDGLVAVVSAAHALERVTLGSVSPVDEWSEASTRPPLEVASGSVELAVMFTPPRGQHLDERYGPSAQLTVSATPAALLVDGAGTGIELTRRLRIRGDVGDGILHVAARAASCDDESGPGAACRVHQQDWGVPIVVTGSGSTRIQLPLSITDPL